ncbi:MAG TPA: hypothetical protein VHH73_07750, partial [Verrucomicrobiae bacterium]|nr:hypothetical protein [Verrucomicrobiae bacterium]
MNKKRPPAVLGLALDGDRLHGVVLKRANGGAQIAATLNVPLALDPLTGDPELVGREIRNHLEAAEIRERRCVFALPLNWALTHQTPLPAELPPGDWDSFLQIEAERGFPYGLDALMVSKSVARLSASEILAMQVAVPREHVVRLEQVLRAARLQPASFSLGLPAMQHASREADRAVLALAAGEAGLGLQVTAGGGLLALRTLDNALETDGREKRILPDVIARDLRIVLGQLPANVRAG